MTEKHKDWVSPAPATMWYWGSHLQNRTTKPSGLYSRPWAVMQTKSVLDKQGFSAILLSLLKHREFGIPTVSGNYTLTGHHYACQLSQAVNGTNKIEDTKAKPPLQTHHKPEQVVCRLVK